ncbi:MAG: phenylalanine--tRNA ligase subunit beta [Candidatus Pacearchaeota archaeon]
MTILTIDKKQFEKEIGKLDEKMQENIAMFGTPIDTFSENDIGIELFPNRPDLLSYQNWKHAFLTYIGKLKSGNEIKINPPLKDFSVKIDSSLSKIRPYTACAIVKNLKFNNERIKEIVDIQEKLHLTLGRKRKKCAIGVYPLEKIRLPITFKAVNPDDIKFMPLESDKEMTGRQILSRHPAGREYGYLLEGLDKYPFFIDNNNEVLSMPPIINSHRTGKITEDTKDIFIECSGFDFNTCNKILNIVVFSLARMGGSVYQMELQYGSNKIKTPEFKPDKIKLSVENANKLLGLELNEADVKKLLEKMGHEYKKGIVSVEPIRTDILHEVDLIEDIAIAYGYNKFEPVIPEVATIGEINKKENIKDKIREILTGIGLVETSSYHLSTKDMQVKNMNLKNEQVSEIMNSKTEYTILRKDLSHYMMKILGENMDVEYPQEIFQIGIVFSGLKEKESLSIAISPGSFTKLKQFFDYLARMLNLEFKISEPSEFPEYFIDGRVAEIQFNGNAIGYSGDVHPNILKNFKVKMPVSLLEISLDEILEVLGK